MSDDLTSALLDRGVLIPEPTQVSIAADVDPGRIESGALLLPGARLEGASTLIRTGAKIGKGGACVVRDCAIGRDVELSSGSFEDAVFLAGASFGPSGHVRAGTLFEEGATAAHAVGTKQTILLPWATLGSNINACDLVLAGGTGAKDHSEIGSGFIHFNYTPFGPAGDKATPSLFGDVVRGVWLRERRVFLGGAGGVVGPVRIGYGSVLAAGSVYRRDRSDGVLVYAESLPDREVPFDASLIRRGPDRVRRNLEYMAELVALHRHYAEVRFRLAGSDDLDCKLVEAGVALIEGAIRERVKQLRRFADGFTEAASRMDDGDHADGLRGLVVAIDAAGDALTDPLRGEESVDARARTTVLADVPRGGVDYPTWVQGLAEETVAAGVQYLRSVAAAWLADAEGAGRILSLC
ncbi:MAG: UDP-N-acetylglucosamine pyrophosphorylase [Planctomycetes bacterium]|nr:UDP-N-acetylglucosamine pyrophosphorylase [Planctomycetota bacterium]